MAVFACGCEDRMILPVTSRIRNAWTPIVSGWPAKSASEQFHLRVGFRLKCRVGSFAVTVVIARNAVLLAQPLHELRKRLAIRLRQESAVLVALPVSFDELRELSFQKRQEDSRRARLQEQGIGEDVFSTRLCRGSNQRLEVPWRIGNAGEHGRADHTGRNPRLI